MHGNLEAVNGGASLAAGVRGVFLSRPLEIFWPLVRSVYFLLEEIFAGGQLQGRGVVWAEQWVRDIEEVPRSCRE